MKSPPLSGLIDQTKTRRAIRIFCEYSSFAVLVNRLLTLLFLIAPPKSPRRLARAGGSSREHGSKRHEVSQAGRRAFKKQPKSPQKQPNRKISKTPQSAPENTLEKQRIHARVATQLPNTPHTIHPRLCHEYRIHVCRGFFEVQAKSANRQKSGYKRLFPKGQF